MTVTLNKRHLLKAGLGAAALAGMPSRLLAETGAPARWAYLRPGFTVLIAQYIKAMGLVKKNGANMAAPTEYTSVSTYYNDFTAGNAEVCIGSWDVFAARYQAGVPIQLLCTITTGDMISIITGDKSVKTVKDLRGKTMAALQSTGTFRMVSALLKELYGLQLGKDVAIQGVDNPAAAVTLVMANRADAGLSWEPNISMALHKRPDLRTIFNAGQAYREQTKHNLPYFAVAVRRDWAAKNPDQVKRVRHTFADCIDGINEHTEDAVKIAGAGTGYPPEVMTDAIRSRRLRFRFGSMADEAERATIVKAGEFMVRNKLLKKQVDKGFFVAT